MRVKEVTLSTNPTVVIGNDYIKAGASITFQVEESDDYRKSIDEGCELLIDAYQRAVFVELSNINRMTKKQTRLRVIRWLKGVLYGKAESDS